MNRSVNYWRSAQPAPATSRASSWWWAADLRWRQEGGYGRLQRQGKLLAADGAQPRRVLLLKGPLQGGLKPRVEPELRRELLDRGACVVRLPFGGGGAGDEGRTDEGDGLAVVGRFQRLGDDCGRVSGRLAQ